MIEDDEIDRERQSELLSLSWALAESIDLQQTKQHRKQYSDNLEGLFWLPLYFNKMDAVQSCNSHKLQTDHTHTHILHIYKPTEIHLQDYDRGCKIIKQTKGEVLKLRLTVNSELDLMMLCLIIQPPFFSF